MVHHLMAHHLMVYFMLLIDLILQPSTTALPAAEVTATIFLTGSGHNALLTKIARTVVPSAGPLDWWAWAEAMCVPAGLNLLLTPLVLSRRGCGHVIRIRISACDVLRQ